MHPISLKKHLIKEFSHERCFSSANSFSLVSCYYHDKKMGFPIGMHEHAFYEINVIAEGKGYHYLGNQCFEANKGSVYVIPPNIKHGYYTEMENYKIFHILLSSAFIKRYKSELDFLQGYSLLFDIEPSIRTESEHPLFLTLGEDEMSRFSYDFNELSALDKENDSNAQILKISKCLYIISILSKMMYDQHISKLRTANIKQTAYSTHILKTIEYMQNHFHEKIKIEELAQIANMSRSTYLRQFYNLCKCTPFEYLVEIRIKKSLEMMSSSEKSITDIALDCGFYDSSHFTKCFVASKGITPTKYRKKMLTEEAV